MGAWWVGGRRFASRRPTSQNRDMGHPAVQGGLVDLVGEDGLDGGVEEAGQFEGACHFFRGKCALAPGGRHFVGYWTLRVFLVGWLRLVA